MITTLTFKSKLNNISGFEDCINPVAREYLLEGMKDRSIVKDGKIVGAVTGVDLENNEFTGVLWCELSADIAEVPGSASSYVDKINISI